MNYVDYIKQNEGLKLKPYKCTSGKLTIGYGRNLEDKGISKSEAEMMLMNDLSTCRRKCHDLFTVFDDLSENRRTVLIDMMFNLGYNGLSKFTKMCNAVNKGKYILASIELLDSNYAQQVPNRADRNAALMREG